MLNIRQTTIAHPLWLLAGLLLPLLALPFADTAGSGGVGLVLLAALGILHLLEIPAALSLGRGRPLRTFGAMLLFMIPAIIGYFAAACFFVIAGTQDTHHKCGNGMLVVLLVPVLTVGAHLLAGMLLSAAVALFKTPDAA